MEGQVQETAKGYSPEFLTCIFKEAYPLTLGSPLGSLYERYRKKTSLHVSDRVAIITGTELSPKRELLCKVWGLYLEKNILFMLTALPFYPKCFGDRLYRVNPHTVRTQTSPPILSPALAFSIH